MNLQDAIRQLTRNAEAIRALAGAFSDEHARWKPDADSWCMQEVLEHLYNEERGDFRRHLKTILGEPQPPCKYKRVDDPRQALEGLMAERAASTAWLATLQAPDRAAPDWDTTIQLRFGPSEETATFSAGDMLVSWVEHDVLHLRQLVELLHAWNERQAAPYSVDYAGGW